MHLSLRLVLNNLSPFSPSLHWSWGTRCGPPSGRPALALTHWAAWTSYLPTATLTSCRCPTPRALPLLAGLSASALGAKTPCSALILNKVKDARVYLLTRWFLYTSTNSTTQANPQASLISIPFMVIKLIPLNASFNWLPSVTIKVPAA